jgi:hypothetical protein
MNSITVKKSKVVDYQTAAMRIEHFQSLPVVGRQHTAGLSAKYPFSLPTS